MSVHRNAWLTWEDSNSNIPNLRRPFEIFKEFRTISPNPSLETFGTILPIFGNAGDPMDVGFDAKRTRCRVDPKSTEPSKAEVPRDAWHEAKAAIDRLQRASKTGGRKGVREGASAQ
jgi:hypothetical protein